MALRRDITLNRIRNIIHNNENNRGINDNSKNNLF